MSTWLLVLTIMLLTLGVTHLLAEWLSQRYTRWIRRGLPFSAREERPESGDPFDTGNRPNG